MTKQQLKKTFLSHKNLPIALHILAWAVIVIIPHYLVYTFGNGNRHFVPPIYINLTIYGILFYLNYMLLVPRLFLKKRKLQYFLLATGLIILVCAVMWYINDHVFIDAEKEQKIKELIQQIDKDQDILKPPIKQFRIVNYFSTSILILGFSLGLKLLEKVGKDEKERKELEKEKLNSELAFLKNQVSPHFFFNTLNNIYSLVEINKEDAQDAILKLSKLMRYLLYESEHGQTKLSNEIDFMRHYIALMQLRVSQKVDINIQLPEKDTDLLVPPLLFISFIENAFKHGISYREKSFINVRMTTDKNKISFQCENSVASDKKEKHDENHSGIGLENVKKRLELLFPENHFLAIESNEKKYSVSLVITL